MTWAAGGCNVGAKHHRPPPALLYWPGMEEKTATSLA